MKPTKIEVVMVPIPEGHGDRKIGDTRVGVIIHFEDDKGEQHTSECKYIDYMGFMDVDHRHKLMTEIRDMIATRTWRQD